ncbi:type II secretion system minor pseudopilin GspK [Reinekea sp.]|jgi:general secretion pathway protein K|uniref:type II secretion system minor pseudopilin GspK n=1 Tax=Reinekea sp. TaxID=1970455 RepID=UPI003989FDEF
MVKQKGIALLQVLLIFALLSIVAVNLQLNQRLNIERALQSLFYSQATVMLDSAETIAKVVLILDEQNSQTDHLYERWNVTEGIFPLTEPKALLETELNDLQGRFNVNWLSMDCKFRESALVGLKQLLTLIGSDPEIADELYMWFDQDSGAEYLYLDKLPTYSPSFQPIADISELNLLNAIEPDTYKEIAPYLSALPANSALNINTAPVEILQIVAPFIDLETANKMVTDRGEDGFKNIEDFKKYPVFTINQDKSVNIPELTVSSQWFELYTSVTIEDKALTQASLLSRLNQEVIIVMRNRSAVSANRIPGDPIKGQKIENDEDIIE